MPRVPQYEQQVTIATPQLPVYQAPGQVREAFGENVQRANQQIGQAAGQLVQVFEDHLIKQEQERRLTELAKQETSVEDHLIKQEQERQLTELAKQETSVRVGLQDKLFNEEIETVEVNGQRVDRPKGILSRQMDQAQGATQEFDEWFARVRQQEVERAPTSKLAGMLGQQLDRIYTGTRDNIISHEAAQGKKSLTTAVQANIEQQINAAYVVQTVPGLAGAMENIAISQSTLDRINGLDEKTSSLNIRAAQEKVVEKAILSSLNFDSSGTTALELLQATKGKIPEESMDAFKQTIKKWSTKLTEDSKVAEKRAMIAKEAQIISGFAKGEYGLNNISPLGQMIRNREIRPEAGAAIIKAIQSPRVKLLPTDEDKIAFVEMARNIFENPEGEPLNDALIDVLNGFSSGHLGREKMELLIQVSRESGGKQTINNFFNSVERFSDSTDLDKGEAIAEYLREINNKTDPQTAADNVIRKILAGQSPQLFNQPLENRK